MTNIIFDIIKSFESNSKTKELRYKDFLTHVYKTFDDKIEASKEKNLKLIFKRFLPSHSHKLQKCNKKQKHSGFTLKNQSDITNPDKW